jgi:hypothetical protein
MPEEKEKLDGIALDEEIAELLDTVEDPLPNGKKPELPVKPPAEEVVAEPVPEPEPEKIIDEEQAKDLKKVIDKFNIIAEKFIDNFDSDRDSIEDTIQRLRDNLIADSAKPRECIVVGLVSALRTKSETNASIIKLLDAYAKLISATKGTNIYQSSTTNIDLTKLLSQDDE